MLKINAIVQARMGSTRLPGKMIADIGGYTLIDLLLRRLKRCRYIDWIVTAVPDRDKTSQIATLAYKYGVVVWGPEDDLPARFMVALESEPCDAFVRICGDSPLIDPVLVDAAVCRWQLDSADFFQPRYMPHGQQVQVCRTDWFHANYAGWDKEHIFKTPSYADGPRMTVDTAADLALLSRVVDRLEDPVQAGLGECLRALSSASA